MGDLKGKALQGLYEQMPTEQLDERLREELKKDPVDENSVRLIMCVLKEREADCETVITPGIEREWERYKEDSGISTGKHKYGKMRGMVLKIVAVLAIFCLVFSTVPLNAEAESLFEKLIRWTEGVFEFFGSRDNQGRLVSYEFQTDNPGLQQVYDAVVGLGITDPVVPMWIPEEYELLEIRSDSTPRKNCLHARFTDGAHELIFEVSDCIADDAHVYYKDEAEAKKFEVQGNTYYTMKNNEKWLAVWSKNNLECSISAECQEEALYEIIRSIYLRKDD